MSSPDVAMPPLKVRRISSKPGRFDPSEPFHMSTRRATNKNSSVNGTPSANGSVYDGDDDAAAGTGQQARASFDDSLRPTTSHSNDSAGAGGDGSNQASLMDAGGDGGVPAVDVPGPSPYPIYEMKSALSNDYPATLQTASGSPTPARPSPSPSLKRKRTASLDQQVFHQQYQQHHQADDNDDDDAIVDLQNQTQNQAFEQDYAGTDDFAEVIDPALLSGREDDDGNDDLEDDAMADADAGDVADDDADDADADDDDADEEREDSQDSSRSDEANPAGEVEVDVSMDATPHISAPESPATSDSINDDDESAPLAKPLNEALQEVVRSSRFDTEEVAEEEQEVDDGEEIEIADADEGDEAEEQVRWGEDGRTRRRLGGRRRAAHSIPIVEAHMRRQAQLKSAYRSVARAQKAILAELAERTVDELEANEKRHAEVAEYNYVMAGLNQVLEQRKAHLNAQRDLTKKDLFRRWQGEKEVARKKHHQRLEDARDNGLDELELNMLRELRIAQLRETEPGYDTQDENDIVPLLNRVKYRWKGREELDSRYDSRSRRQLETRSLGDQWMRRLDLQDLIADHTSRHDDVQLPETHAGDVAVMNSGPRDYANARRQCVEDTRTLAAAALEVERVAKIPVVKNEDAIGLQMLGDLASRPSITSGMRDAMFPKPGMDSRMLDSASRTLLPPPPGAANAASQHLHQQHPPPPAAIEPPSIAPIQFSVSPRAANLLGDRIAHHQMPPPSTPKQSSASYLRSAESLRQEGPTLPPPGSDHRLNGTQSLRGYPGEHGYPATEHSYPTDHRPPSRHSQHQYETFRPGSFPPMRDQPPPPPETFPSPSSRAETGPAPPLPLWRAYSQPDVTSRSSSRPPSVGGPAPFPLAIVPASNDERSERGGAAEEYPRPSYRSSSAIKDEPRLEPAVRLSPWQDHSRPLYALEPRPSEGSGRLPPLHDSSSSSAAASRHQRTNSSHAAPAPDPRWRDYGRPSLGEPSAPQEQPYPARYPVDLQPRPPPPPQQQQQQQQFYSGSPRAGGEEKIRLPSLMPREPTEHGSMMERANTSFGSFRPLEAQQAPLPGVGSYRSGEEQHHYAHYGHSSTINVGDAGPRQVSSSERPKSAVSRPSSSSASAKDKTPGKRRSGAGTAAGGTGEGSGGTGPKTKGTRRVRKAKKSGDGKEDTTRSRGRKSDPARGHSPPSTALAHAGSAGIATGLDGASPPSGARPPPLSVWPSPPPARNYEHHHHQSHASHPPGLHSPESRYANPPYHGGAPPYGSSLPPPPPPPRRYSPSIPSPTEQERGGNGSYYRGSGVPAPPPPPPFPGGWNYPPPPPSNSHSHSSHSHQGPPPPPGMEHHHQQFNPYGPTPPPPHQGPFPLHHSHSGSTGGHNHPPPPPSLSSLPPPPPPPPGLSHHQQHHQHQHQHPHSPAPAHLQQQHQHPEQHQHHRQEHFDRSPRNTTTSMQFPGGAGGPPLAPASGAAGGAGESRGEGRAATVGPERLGGSSGSPGASANSNNHDNNNSGNSNNSSTGTRNPRLSGGSGPGGLPAFAQRGQGQSNYRRRRQSDGFHVHKFHNYLPGPVTPSSASATAAGGTGGGGTAGAGDKEKERDRGSGEKESGTEKDKESNRE